MFLPKDTQRQKIGGLAIDISHNEKYRLTQDSFGNRKLYGLIEETHDDFEVTVSGDAETGLDICEEYTVNPYAYSFLKAQTALTSAGKTLREYHRNLELDNCSGVYEKALCMMNTLHYTFIYDTEATKVHETAENALIAPADGRNSRALCCRHDDRRRRLSRVGGGALQRLLVRL